MSFTLMRHKNGKPTPIKLSIWDAFKGAPPPRSRLHECPQCGKFHRPGSKHDTAAPVQVPATEAAPAKKDEKPPEGSKPEEAPANEHNFTPEEDQKILEMKAENTAWAKIAESLGNGRSKSMVQYRYKQIKPTETKPEEKLDGKEAEKPVEEDKKTEKPFEQMTKAEKKAFKAQQAREEGLKKRDEAKAKEEKSKEEATATTAVSEEAPAAAATAPAPGPAPVPGPTSSQAALKERQKWIAAASKHFDKTGQRITPEQARKIAEGAA